MYLQYGSVEGGAAATSAGMMQAVGAADMHTCWRSILLAMEAQKWLAWSLAAPVAKGACCRATWAAEQLLHSPGKNFSLKGAIDSTPPVMPCRPHVPGQRGTASLAPASRWYRDGMAVF